MRRRNLEDLSRRQTDREAAPAESDEEALPPPPPESSAELWAYAKAEDVNPEYMSQGPGWYALFNPGLDRRFNVNLAYTLAHDRCESFTASTALIMNNIIFFDF